MTSPNLLKTYKSSKMYGWHAYALNKILKYASKSKATDYWVLKYMLMLSHTQLSATPWTVALEAPLSMGFLRQEHWSGLPFPPLGESSRPRDRTHISCSSQWILYHWATREASITYLHRSLPFQQNEQKNHESQFSLWAGYFPFASLDLFPPLLCTLDWGYRWLISAH